MTTTSTDSSKKTTKSKGKDKDKPNGNGVAAAPEAPPAEEVDQGVDTGPVEKTMDDEIMRYKLKALQLEFEREGVRVQQRVQQRLNEILSREQRNDPKWKKCMLERKGAIDEALKTLTLALPAGYAITNIDPAEGTYRASHDPESRAELLNKKD